MKLVVATQLVHKGSKWTAKAGENQAEDFRVAEGVLGNALDRAELPRHQRFI